MTYFKRIQEVREVLGFRPALVIVLLAVVSCGRRDEKRAGNEKLQGSGGGLFRADGSSDLAFESIEIAERSGERSAVVGRFFEAWKRKEYAAMQSMLEDDASRNGFDDAMKKTPVRWMKVRIEDDPASPTGVLVHINFTDLASVMTAFAFCHRKEGPFFKKVTRETPFPATPNALGIETFESVVETWTVNRTEGGMKIHPDQGKEVGFLLYTLYAGRGTYTSTPVDDPKDSPIGMFHLARIMQKLNELLGRSDSELDKIYPLIKEKSGTLTKRLADFQPAN